ncbi:histidine phosphatase family protein [Streptomyces sasae]|uniref:histidine phosphatase family protein n=1 Tax=Streptomyces sasae TaxID=1266772 RepID=UPI00292D33B1|nr:histidine phosphatase family protein [Streptomyces sasae]
MRRAREAAWYAGSRTGVRVREDARLRERMNRDGVQPMEDLLADRAASVKYRDFVPAAGGSSRDTAERIRARLVDLADEPRPVALVTHGGVTVDLPRALIGDDAVAVELMRHGVPSCAITTLDDLPVADVASVAHLA